MKLWRVLNFCGKNVPAKKNNSHKKITQCTHEIINITI